MLWKPGSAAFVVALFLLGSSLLALRYLFFPHQPMTWVAVFPRAFAARRWAQFAMRSARARLTSMRTPRRLVAAA
jgi:hypothetical protein